MGLSLPEDESYERISEKEGDVDCESTNDVELRSHGA